MYAIARVALHCWKYPHHVRRLERRYFSDILRPLREWFLTFFFFFQAEDGIRDKLVTGVQTCALPIYFFSDHRAHGPAHEVEIHHREVERHAVQTAVAGAHRLEGARLLHGRLEALRVVLEVEGVGGVESGVELVPGTFIY